MLLILTALVFAAQTVPDSPGAERAMLLVMPLRAEAKLAASARALDELILEAVDGLGRYQVLGSSDLNALLGVEKMKDAIACEDTVCAAEIGGALGAPYLLAGELRALDQQVVLSLRLMDTRKQTVAARAVARGSTNAESLSQMMAQVVGACFKTTVQSGAAPPTDTDFSGYTSIATEVGGYVSRGEYSSLLAKIGEFEARAKKAKSPAGGVSADELVAYYHALACFTLKREPCVTTVATHYQKEWPSGAYRSAIETYVTTFEDQRTAKRDREAEVAERIVDIREKSKNGVYEPLQADELVAFAYYSGQDYAQAAKQFAHLLDKLYAQKPPQVEKVMSVTSSAVYAWQQVGDFDAARRALKQAEELDAKAYRTGGLQQTARSLPK